MYKFLFKIKKKLKSEYVAKPSGFLETEIPQAFLQLANTATNMQDPSLYKRLDFESTALTFYFYLVTCNLCRTI